MFKKFRQFKIQSLTLIFVLCSLVYACSGTIVRSNTPPDWTLGQSAKYPNALYVTATGSASNAEDAKDRAMGNISKIFEAHVFGSTSTLSNTQTQMTSAGEEVIVKQRLIQRVNVHTDKVLEGIQIVEQWQNAADLTYFALAVINRQHVGGILIDDIKKLDKETAFELSAIDTEKDNLKRVAGFQRVIRLQETRKNSQKTLKIIDLTGKGVRPKWSLVELKAFSASALAEINMSAYVDVHSSGDVRKLELKQLLQSAMSHAGFSVVQGVTDYTLLAEVELQSPDEKQGWFWQRGTLEIRLIDAMSGVTRGRYSWELTASATQRSLLLSRFKQRLDKILKTELKAVLIAIAGE